ncbi:hypothetical protein V7S43_001908 [Phytophthora oleae]|uniref:Signal recognition particle subunit SRP68 n=1 Tax=Phytophthora oleae TaxID=2107226 RepID=A0ABD3G0L1_9STRA
MLYLRLYNAERVCGYAMQLKEDDNLDKPENGEDANSHIKFRLIGRFRKATEWSKRLVEICAARLVLMSARVWEPKLTLAAYMAGSLAFHRHSL